MQESGKFYLHFQEIWQFFINKPENFEKHLLENCKKKPVKGKKPLRFCMSIFFCFLTKLTAVSSQKSLLFFTLLVSKLFIWKCQPASFVGIRGTWVVYNKTQWFQIISEVAFILLICTWIFTWNITFVTISWKKNTGKL